MRAQPEIMPWEEVAYSATFLRSTMLGSRCGWRGKIVSKDADPLYLVQWVGMPEPCYVNKFNLVSTERRGGLQADAERCEVWGLNEGTKRFKC